MALMPFPQGRFTCWSGALVLLVVLLLAGPVVAQRTTADGFIRSDAWLVLGPFRQGVGCGARGEELLGNFIAPAAIPCEYPVAGDEVEYDAFRAESTEYIGPLGPSFLPVWRPLEDGVADAVADLLGDPGYGCESGDDNVCSHVVSWLVTYFVLDAPGPVDAEVCLGTDDGRQLWLDDRLVWNRAGCRPHRLCDEIVTVTIAPGAHRIAVASFDGTGDGWNASVGVRVAGEPIRDDSPGWTFLGGARPAIDAPPCPELVSPVRFLSCAADSTGVDVSWQNPSGAERSQTIVVRVDGEEALRVPGNEDAVRLPAAALGDLGGATICVVNASGFESCCEVVLLEPVVVESCRRLPDGSIDVSWRNPPNASAEQSISVSVNGADVATVAGTATSVRVAADAFEGPATEVCVRNASGTASCCNPLATDTDGLITSRNWLVLGPFEMRKPITCKGRDSDDDLLKNFIAPTEIACEYPRLGDTIDYDAPLAATRAYVGPSLRDDATPFWRPLDDGTPDDGDNDLAAEFLEPIEGVMSWLATYVEYRGRPIDATLCVGVPDGGQIWLDDEMVFNRNSCGERETCEQLIGVRVTPGVHRIAIGAFNGRGRWGTRLGIRLGDDPVIDDPERFPDWTFHGRARPDAELPCGPDRPRPQFIRGDCNGDGRVGGSVTDAVFLLNHSFAGGPAPPCLAACDADADGRALGSVTDAVFLLTFSFISNRNPPPAPFPDCGPSDLPSDVALGCERAPPSCR